MAETKITVIVYRAIDGRRPFLEWLRALRDRTGANQVRVRLARMRLGNVGDVKPVGKGVYEARIAYGPGYRIYFARRGNELIVLLCGGDKGTQTRDIERAQGYWIDFQERML
jgi:putative addiction module killer protein